MTCSAVRSIKPPEPIDTIQSDVCELVVDILKGTNNPRGIAIEEIISQAGNRGIGQSEVLSAIESLIVEDECYQPQKGFVKLL
jgi:DNA replicative helicase MCM subunit Mcm2 (Cdc46/Mcm family)